MGRASGQTVKQFYPMKIHSLSLIITAVLGWPHHVIQSLAKSEPPAETMLWYRQPAKDWLEALPLGNGRLGAMVFGGLDQEQIQLNEETLWSGGGPWAIPSSVRDQLPKIRQLFFEGNYAEGEQLVQRLLLSGPRGDRNSHQTLGDLWLSMNLKGNPSAYQRSLDLDTGVAATAFTLDGVSYRREVFCSAPDQVLVTRISSDQPRQITLTARLQRPNAKFETAGPDTLVMRGQALSGNRNDGVHFAAVLKVVAEGGAIQIETDRITITGADAVTLLVTAASDFNRLRPLEPLKTDFGAQALAQARAASLTPYVNLKAGSVADHQRLFRRVELQLSLDPAPLVPTDERLAAVMAGADDPNLVELYFQYGRYLLMGSSRPGDMPANLQGIWNKDLNAPWGADYHININIQMNYWPAESCNLSECHEPFFDFVEALAATSGRRAAREFYGARGFVGHYTTDAWLYTPSSGSPSWALWQMGGAWCTRHFIEHYWYTGDRVFLEKRAYPILRDASLFLLDWLAADPKTGKLVSGPSASPENTFVGSDGKNHSVTMGCSMDQEIVWDTFHNFLEAARELGLTNELTAQIQAAIDRLALPGIGKDGRLLEWSEELKEAEPGHRHLSHLFAVHPGSQFTSRGTPEAWAAARKSLEYRLANGGGHTGWSRAWIINFWARFGDAEKAYENVQLLLQKSTLKNLFDNHPPFQIDGNFGGTAGIAEMLLQSDVSASASQITVLPALPKAWRTGFFKGLRARGGFEVNAFWENGRATRVEIASTLGRRCQLRMGDQSRELDLKAGTKLTVTP
jgi:alpha-L-fucosidase 2